MAPAHSTTARNLCVAVTYTDVRGVEKRVHGQRPIKGCAVWQVPIKMWECGYGSEPTRHGGGDQESTKTKQRVGPQLSPAHKLNTRPHRAAAPRSGGLTLRERLKPYLWKVPGVTVWVGTRGLGSGLLSTEAAATHGTLARGGVLRASRSSFTSGG